MLKSTYLHVQGIGEATERKIWSDGLRTWYDFLAAVDAKSFRKPRWAAYAAEVRESVSRFGSNDWKYFDRVFPGLGKWRAFGDFPGRALYLDIETNGGVTGADITVIGTYDGVTAKSFVAGVNLEAAQEEIEKFPVLVTYNGAQFDMPIVRDRFRYNFFNHIHVDLRFPLHRLGYRGGLKVIERQLGIARSDATRGLDGFDAVRLWREYERGSKEALDLVIEYNREDIVNLKPLMELVYQRMSEKVLECWGERLAGAAVPERCAL
jgi:uncharacterized protein YprB with RNaseH-like and TPR domain